MRKRSRKECLTDFDQASAVVLGATIAAGAGLAGGLLTSWRQAKLQERVWLQGARRELARTLASAAHSMMWSTYKALNVRPSNPDDLHAYEQEYHQAVAELVSSQMELAGLDEGLYRRVTPLVSEAIALGADTFLALSSPAEGVAEQSTAALLDCNRRALALIKRIPDEL